MLATFGAEGAARRLTGGALALFAAIAVAACDGSPAQPTSIELDLTGCIAGDAATDSCRARLSAMAPPGSAACLVLRPTDDPTRIQRLAMVWDAARLVPAADADVLTVQGGEGITVALFALSAPVANCGVFDIETACAAADGCALRLGPVERRIAPSGSTALDFRGDDGRCASEVPARDSPMGAFNEVCGDGIDNDCDGIADEPLPLPCRVGVGACENMGQRSTCVDGAWQCDAVPLAASVDADCNGIDDDCDDRIDESGGCGECLFDNECLTTPATPQCVGGVCRACDPTDDAGCGPEAPVCDAADQTCRTCADDGECPGALCVDGRCRACDPTRVNSCPEPGEPTCDPATFTCRPCRDGAECASGTCFGGRCATCDPATHAGCAAPEVVCDLNTLACRRCEADAECRRADPAHPICRDGACVECDPLDDSGCDGNRPICIEEDGTPPRCAPCVEDGECPTGQCRTGRCVGCDPVDDSGCDPLGGQPVCDENGPDGAFCRGCVGDIECPGGLGRGVCAAGRCVECADETHGGCLEGADEPICQNGVCRPCAGDNECLSRPGALDLCVGGRCVVCDDATDRGCVGRTPICDAGACRACRADPECGDRQCVGGACLRCDPADHAGCPPESPICVGGDACRPCDADAECLEGRLCVAGRCLACDPGTDRGCDPGGVAPICDPQTATCRRCNLDRDCDAGQCLGDGRCAECDPAVDEGCDPAGAAPICQVDGTCQGCRADAECIALDADDVCDLATGRCVDCVAAGNRGCDPAGVAPICRGGACEPCGADAECGAGALCEGGRCVGCSVIDNSGCDPLGAAPICDGGACRECRQSVECRDPTRRFCVGGACQPCDPVTGAGCELDGATPVCVAGVCQRCDQDEQCAATVDAGPLCLDDGRCGTCDPVDSRGCDIGSAQPVCDAFSLLCNRCNVDAECPVGNCDIVSGRCVPCGPAGADCDIASAQPICDPETQACRACVEGSNDCAGNVYGSVCRAGACGCDPGNVDSCVRDSNRPICAFADQRCRRCVNDGECGGNPSGGQCVQDGRCRVCDLADFRNNSQRYAGCNRDNPICVRDGEACVPRCRDNGDCNGGTTCQDNGDGRTGCQ